VVERLIACPAPRQAYGYHGRILSQFRTGSRPVQANLESAQKERGFYVRLVSL